jgi:aryl carrier-like protein
MFSSRTTSFSKEIMKITNGRGVDVCLNSLTGDMLHESWRCIAEDGSLIEIGKKDILDRNSLSMEPFDRNCSYRAFDLSRFTWERISEISEDVLDLIHRRHLRPLHICAVFSFENIVEAFRYMQRGSHIGKVVISFENSKITKVPIRPASQELRLRPDGSYLYAGGIKGMGGSLAVYMACRGAKNIVVISRSGYDDAKSQKVISDCKALGCHVGLMKGSVTEIDDVRRAYTTASKPVIGIIHGAAMLRDRPLFSMTLEEFHDPILPKVKGTWNLHNVAQELGLKLDFFILLSSLSGLLGQPGQANYTTGNVFQDSFATYRLQQGLAASSLNLGPVDEVGWLSSSKVLDRFFESRGWSAIKEKLLHRILRASILQQTHTLNPYSTGVMITGFVPEKPPFEAVHRFSALRPAAGSVSARGENFSGGFGRNKLDLLKNAANADIDKDTLLAAAVDVMNEVMMRNLGVKEPLDAARPLADYGVDSLTTIELRNWIRVELAIDVSVLESMRARTLKALSETVVNKLLRC